MSAENNKIALRVVVIGAGMSGLLAGIKLLEMGITDVTLYEKADRIGGTWRENTYPGLTCDVPSHHYTYSFERNPDWTRHLPPGEEIQAYFERTCDRYAIRDLIQFGCGVVNANFVDGAWHLQLEDGRLDQADIVIAATGVLHHPNIPEIPGADTFQGALFHTARWDHDVPLQGKRVGVIGNGSTGVQIVSALAGKAALVEHYQRTPQWIMPVENGYFSESERAAFRDDPDLLAKVMNVEEYTANVERYTMGLIDPDSPGAQYMANECLMNLENNVVDAELRERLRPDHRAMCKRLIFSPDYYKAIQHPQAALITDGIEAIEPTGIRTRDGELHPLDVIAYATGFRSDQFMRPMQITGRNDTTLEQLWQRRPVAYQAITLPEFPNFFMLNGPNGPVGNFSLIDIAEHQWVYISQLIEKIRSGACRQISPHRDAMEDFDQRRTEAAKKTVFYTGGCNSWYLDAEGVPATWPWNYSRFVNEMETPDWSAFEMTG